MSRGYRFKGNEPPRSTVLARIECLHCAIRPLEADCAHPEYARRDRFRARLNARSQRAAREWGWSSSRSEDGFAAVRDAVDAFAPASDRVPVASAAPCRTRS